MNTSNAVRAGGAAALALVIAGACMPYNGLEDVLGAGTAIQGEVRSVDSRRGSISIRDDQSRTHSLRADRGTVVVYRQNRYPVSALERGDRVRATFTTDRNGTRWAERVDVIHSVRDGSGATGQVSRLEGRVSRVDARRGQFRLDRGRAGTTVVHVPPRVSRDDARRFDRLRSGDRVRVDVRTITRSEAELVRFR